MTMMMMMMHSLSVIIVHLNPFFMFVTDDNIAHFNVHWKLENCRTKTKS